MPEESLREETGLSSCVPSMKYLRMTDGFFPCKISCTACCSGVLPSSVSRSMSTIWETRRPISLQNSNVVRYSEVSIGFQTKRVWRKANKNQMAILSDVEEMVRLFREGGEDMELEVKVQTSQGGGGEGGGIPKDMFERVVSTVGLEKERGWKEHHDYFWKDEQGRTVRTRCRFDVHDLDVRPETVHKERVRTVRFREGCIDFKVCLSRERKVDMEWLKDKTCSTSLVRIQQRRRFVWKDAWAYEFSNVWQDTTRTGTERKRWSEPARNEIEIELLRERGYLSKHTDRHVAASMLMKITDLMHPEGKSDFVEREAERLRKEQQEKE